jgi:hypothetical protein
MLTRIEQLVVRRVLLAASLNDLVALVQQPLGGSKKQRSSTAGHLSAGPRAIQLGDLGGEVALPKRLDQPYQFGRNAFGFGKA